MRLLALDLGTKKCGVAISDPLQIIAQPLTTIFYKTQDWTALIIALEGLMQEYKPIAKIILGLPCSNYQPTNPMTKVVGKFKQHLEEIWPHLEVVLFSEAYTSQAADRVMSTLGLSIRQKKHQRDQLAAQQLLEHYLLTAKL